MINYCPKCKGEIITISDNSGVTCSRCDWKAIKPKAPTPPPARKYKDFAGIMVRVYD